MGRIRLPSPPLLSPSHTPRSPSLGGGMFAGSVKRRSSSVQFLVLVGLNLCAWYFVSKRWEHSAVQEALGGDLVHAVVAPAPIVLDSTAELGKQGLAGISTTLSVPPALSCELCAVSPNDPLCEYGLDTISQSRAYEGSGARVRRMLERALRGEKIRIGVIGASVSCGHGVSPSGHAIWWEAFFQDFSKMFPSAEIFNGAQAAMDSKYFSFCFSAALPPDLDLYLVELDINQDASWQTYKDDDALFRELLSLPNEPAVIRVSVFAVLFADMARGTPSGLVTSQWMDVPTLSVRNPFLADLIHNPDKMQTYFGDVPDYRHIGPATHRAMGDFVSLYIRKQVCETVRRRTSADAVEPRAGTAWPRARDFGKVPRLSVWMNYFTKEEVVPLTPSCQVAVSKYTPLKPLDFEPGWIDHEWNGKRAWRSHTPGPVIRFAFEGVRVGAFVWSTKGPNAAAANAAAANAAALREDSKTVAKVSKGAVEDQPGQMACWVDDDRTVVAFMDAYWDKNEPGPEFHFIREDLRPGKHILSCRVLESSSTNGHDVRIQGIASQ